MNDNRKQQLLKHIKNQITKCETLEHALLDAYAKQVASNVKLLVTAFEVAFVGSVNQFELLESEMSNIENILNNGIETEITITDWSEVVNINADSIAKIYSKLVRGLEPMLIKKFAENINDFKNLITTKALIEYKAILDEMFTEISVQKKNNTTEPNNPYPQIFSDNEYELFLYLNTEYSRDNKSLVAKYSYIYHFLKYENSILGTQLEYIAFILSKYGLTMSKILAKNLKYEDEIQSLLMRLHTNFKQ